MDRAAVNERQRKFVERFMATGNATKSAIAAGYSEKTARVQGSQLLTNPAIQQAIKKRTEQDPRIATREDRQRFWSEVMLGTGADGKVEMNNRLKASELLAKSQADFTPRDDSGHPLPLEIRLTDDAATASDPE